MEKISAVVIAVLLFTAISVNSYALTVDTLNTAFVEDFNDFSGTGFMPNPVAGQLDSDDWRVTGLSDGDSAFGDSNASGDFARGQSAGGVGTGGIYAFDVDNDSGENYAVGVQPGGSDFTPGSLRLSLFNSTGYNLTSLLIEYDFFVYNDKSRSNSFNFAYSSDDNAYVDVAAADFSSTAAADASPQWTMYSRNINIDNLDILETNNFYLRWSGNDVSGSGSRDEFALDNLRITAFSTNAIQASTVPEPSTLILFGSGLAGLALWRRKTT